MHNDVITIRTNSNNPVLMKKCVYVYVWQSKALLPWAGKAAWKFLGLFRWGFEEAKSKSEQRTSYICQRAYVASRSGSVRNRLEDKFSKSAHESAHGTPPQPLQSQSNAHIMIISIISSAPQYESVYANQHFCCIPIKSRRTIIFLSITKQLLDFPPKGVQNLEYYKRLLEFRNQLTQTNWLSPNTCQVSLCCKKRHNYVTLFWKFSSELWRKEPK